MFTVSVIIPNYNHAPYLEQRIESVLNQTWQQFELILLDDCSTDNSRQILERYKNHEKVSALIYNDQNSGNTFTQWEKGIQASHHDYLWIAESDDWCEDNFLETIMQGIGEDSECVLGYCQSYCIENDIQVRWQSQHGLLKEQVPGRDFIQRFMTQNTAIFNASMAVWKRSAFDKISPAFKDFRFCGDWLFWIEMSLQGNVFISGRLLNYFRKHAGDVTMQSTFNGDVISEEVKLFTLIHNRKWISDEIYYSILERNYFYFRSIQPTFGKAAQERILSVFNIGNIEPTLQKAYQRHLTRKWVKSLVSRVIK